MYHHEKFSGTHEKRCFVTTANERYLQGSKSGTLSRHNLGAMKNAKNYQLCSRLERNLP
jgi:hypothetical protein